MKLVTFQSLDALEFLNKNGYLVCNDNFINKEKYGEVYNWIVEKMESKIKNTTNVKYPIWAWAKCYNGTCPPKVKNKDQIEQFRVKITFHKDEKDIFITDYRRYSFVLKNFYIPSSLKDKKEFDKKLEKYNITDEDLKAYIRRDKYEKHREDDDYLNICKQIRKSFDRCITRDSNILQGCVWKINKDEIDKIEIIKDDGYLYGSLNYIRANGKRMDWVKQFYKMLK